MMVIGLYTSRVILQNLGVIDYGIYNAVGGIVGMIGLVSGSLSGATYRFIAIAIGKDDSELCKMTFGNIKVIFYCLCLLVVAFGETVGLWLLYNKMVIPGGRMTAAFWVLQLSIANAVLSFICIPYSAAIIAHERMSAFAWIAVLDSVFKLVVCLALVYTPADRLITYAFLLFLVSFIDRLIYATYCNKHFVEVKAKPRIYREQFKEIFSYSSWTMSGSVASVLNNQGVNLLLNMFFGPVVNAARGVALQAQGVMTQFATIFQTTATPQITKSYARNDFYRMRELVSLCTKTGCFLLLIIYVPVFIEAPTILRLWLVTVPDNTVIFLRFILCCEFIKGIWYPLDNSILATGNVRKYQTLYSGLMISAFPVIYVLFHFFGAPAYSAFVVLLVCEFIGLWLRIWIALPMIRMSFTHYFRTILLPVMLVAAMSPIAPLLSTLAVHGTWSRLLLVVLASEVSCGIFILSIGLNSKERSLLYARINHSKLLKIVKTKSQL